MASSDKTEVITHLRNILANFLKLTYSAIQRSQQSWTGTIVRARLDLSLKVDDSARLRNAFPELLIIAYKQARTLAASDMRLNKHDARKLFPEECPWNIDDHLRNEDFVPETAPTANGRTR